MEAMAVSSHHSDSVVAATEQPGGPGAPATVAARAPALSLFLLMALGIATSEVVRNGFPDAGWWWLGALAFAASLLGRRSRLIVRVSLAVAVFALAGLHQRLSVSLPGPDHILTFVPEEGGPARFQAIISERPIILPASDSRAAWQLPEYDQTRLIVDVTAWIETASTGTVNRPASGRLWVDVEGHLVGVARGDVVDIAARVYPPGGLRNPGGFDFRDYLARRRIHAAASCEQPEAVRRIAAESARSPYQWVSRFRDRLRDRIEATFLAVLSEETSALGLALLLGTRTDLPEDLRDAFARSGSMHLLAISGANVVVLAGVLWCFVAVLTRSRRLRVLFLMAGLAGYLWLTEWQAPVFRSVVMMELVLWARLSGRTISGWNALGLAGIAGLVVRPQDLWEPGAQLSFLAVAGLLCAGVVWRHFQRPEAPALDVIPRWRRAVASILHLALFWTLTTGFVWLFTLPLTLHRFHLFSGIGLILGVVLAPLSAAILGLGYVTLLLAATIAPLAIFPGWLFDHSLRALMAIVRAGAYVPAGHVYLAGPSAIWTGGFYVLLLGGIAWIRAGRSIRGPGYLLVTWCLIAVMPWSGLWRSPHLSVVMLAVGHGGATLVHLPNGRTVLYDAGRLQDHDRARQIIQQALWSAGKSQVDLVLLSHADIDHFNALPGLLTSIPVGMIAVHPAFLREEQAAVRELLQTIRDYRIPIRLVWRGDRFLLDPTVQLSVLSPDAAFRGSEDNAASIVFEIEYQQRRILLTGDLEADGLDHFLQQPGPRVDLLQAPHHGAVAANTTDLERRAVPAWVWVAGGRDGTLTRLRTVYPAAEAILSTREDGALTADISPTGELRVSSVGQ
jgi:competence protein ComEC